MVKELKQKYINKEISQRQLITYIKNNIEYQDELKILYPFLESDDIIEYIYYLINDINEIQVCPYCNNKRKWTKRLTEGYKTTCCSKECESKRISNQKTGQTIISNNRDKDFIEKQNKIRVVTDKVIIDLIKYDKYVPLITNDCLLVYLKNRYKDSSSLIETVQRIRLGIENKPLCPTCGNPVRWIGKKSKLYTTYCSNTCSANSKETYIKKKATLIKNWGTEHCYDSDKYKNLMKAKYGVEYIWQRDDVKEKRKNTLLKKYGVENPTQNKDIMNKVWETCKLHKTFPGSRKEDDIYNWLIELGYNVIRQYKSEKYPFNCDFYLSDYDVYIEYQGSQFHHNRAYLGTKDDLIEIEKLQKDITKKLLEGKNPQSSAIIETWTQRDVYKRTIAKQNNVKLFEIFECDNIESLNKQLSIYFTFLLNKQIFIFSNDILWKEYNKFLKLHIIKDLKDIKHNFLTNNIIKHFLGNVFYKNEINEYVSNPITRRALIQNRCKYLNKSESELNINELLSGYKISGIYYGYSHFNPQWTNWFINKFNIKSVYDPCGGWGHHMFGMLSCDKIIYNDLSTSTYNGICQIKNYFNITQLECYNEDATEFIPDNVDAFFMCPPYYNLEHYECGDFENIESYKIFLNKIFDIWKKNTASIFGVILREDFAAYIECEYSEKIEIPVSTSHIVKSKKYKEYFYIYKK